MTVYVDSMFVTVPSERWPYTSACHLFTDGDEKELFTFALDLGLELVWLQYHKTLPHFDLTRRMREKALRQGAVAIEGREYGDLLLRLVKERGSQHGLGTG